jgi:hypothetical protein
VGLESSTGNNLENMVCKSEPLSKLVKMGRFSALACVQVTCVAAPGNEAPFSLPQSIACANVSIVHAYALQLGAVYHPHHHHCCACPSVFPRQP